MKLFASFAVTFVAVQAVWANPMELRKRAAPGDTANLGYATTNGGTTGGSGGSTVTVSTLAALTSAVAGTSKKIVIVTGTITGNTVVKIGSNTSVIGRNGATLNGVGLQVANQNNVIIRNLKITKVLADVGDAIGVQYANNIWLDHLDLSSDKDHDKDYYDGLLDITHGCQAVTVSYCKLHDHYKGSLCGASDSNTEDMAMSVTYAFNVFNNIGSRTPSFRFGTGHVYNNYFTNNGDGINTRVGAQMLIENNKFVACKKALFTTDGGYAIQRGNDYGGASADALTGSLSSVPYSYALGSASNVPSLTSSAGNTLSI